MFNLLLSVMLSIFVLQGVSDVQPIEPNPDKPLGEVVSIEKASSEFNEISGKKLMLPTYLPFEPTVSGGSVDTGENSVRVDYLDEESGKSISLSAYTKEFRIKSAKGDYINLGNGLQAEIIEDDNIDFTFITFKDKDLKYLIAINKYKFEKNKSIDELVKVANSLH